MSYGYEHQQAHDRIFGISAARGACQRGFHGSSGDGKDVRYPLLNGGGIAHNNAGASKLPYSVADSYRSSTSAWNAGIGHARK